MPWLPARLKIYAQDSGAITEIRLSRCRLSGCQAWKTEMNEILLQQTQVGRPRTRAGVGSVSHQQPNGECFRCRRPHGICQDHPMLAPRCKSHQPSQNRVGRAGSNRTLLMDTGTSISYSFHTPPNMHLLLMFCDF